MSFLSHSTSEPDLTTIVCTRSRVKNCARLQGVQSDDLLYERLTFQSRKRIKKLTDALPIDNTVISKTVTLTADNSINAVESVIFSADATVSISHENIFSNVEPIIEQNTTELSSQKFVDAPLTIFDDKINNSELYAALTTDQTFTEITNVGPAANISDISQVVNVDTRSLIFTDFDLHADSALSRVGDLFSSESNLLEWDNYNPTYSQAKQFVPHEAGSRLDVNKKLKSFWNVSNDELDEQQLSNLDNYNFVNSTEINWEDVGLNTARIATPSDDLLTEVFETAALNLSN